MEYTISDRKCMWSREFNFFWCSRGRFFLCFFFNRYQRISNIAEFFAFFTCAPKKSHQISKNWPSLSCFFTLYMALSAAGPKLMSDWREIFQFPNHRRYMFYNVGKVSKKSSLILVLPLSEPYKLYGIMSKNRKIQGRLDQFFRCNFLGTEVKKATNLVVLETRGYRRG